MASSSSGLPIPEIHRYGLTQVYLPDGGGNVDVVFVHGLNGGPAHTWTAEKSHMFWPLQLLPPILKEERARILIYGYDADVTSFTDAVTRDKIQNHAEHLVAVLAENRHTCKATQRPIIFVAHSLGGLVVKKALIYSHEIISNHLELLRSIFVSTYGILFLGTPHKGSDIAKWGSVLERISRGVVPSGLGDSNPNLVNALKGDSETLQAIDHQFNQMISRFHVYFFHEGKKTNLGKMKMNYIVDEESASPRLEGVGRAVIQEDHSHMCKFENEAAPGFDLVAGVIQRYAGEAPDIIRDRWEAEMVKRKADKNAQIHEISPDLNLNTPRSGSTSIKTITPDTSQLLPPKTSPKPDFTDNATNTPSLVTPPKPPEAYFIVPPGFRPNTFFIGTEREYQELDRRLFDKRRRVGTACVVLHGQPGVGKSHLARQYVNTNRNKFHGGIFWITAKTKEERYHAFWNIKQKVVARDAPDLCDGVNGNDFVQTVRTWFESRHEWLIVFDGVTLERDEDATELAKFIPDSQHSSIIYVSRAKNLESKQRLLRPFPIKVGPLKEDDAKKLLFKTLGRKKPTDIEKKKASELVKKIGGLPLAINAIGHRLADTHEPLAKFKLSYSASPGLESTYNQTLDDLLKLGHTEAWNLINILCWFGQHIPVEMVNLGLRILKAEKVEVKSTEDGGEADINTTFGILMRYALIERNEPETDRDSMSSSRDSLIEPEPIDILKIHSVVQNFCCGSLYARGLHRQWLGYAVKLFSYSYHQADIKIKQKPEPGRVSDYRYYLVHGQRLLDHCEAYESKSQSPADIKDILHRIVDMITEEILKREPDSSQESPNNGIFQISIFDRTSSSSESMPSAPGPPTPDHRPTPPPLENETIFGFPLGKPMDSPNSFRTVSSGVRPKIVGHSPERVSLQYEDVGYDSDREDQSGPTSMHPSLSEMTARPPSRSRAGTTESQNERWQLVASTRRQRRQRGRRDVGSFRPTLARAHIDRQSAVAMIGLSQEENAQPRRESSSAREALKKVQSQSPPPSRGGVAAFFQRRPSPAILTRPTWAGIVAGKKVSSQQPAGTKSPRDFPQSGKSPLAMGFRSSEDINPSEDFGRAAYTALPLYSNDDQHVYQPPTQKDAALSTEYPVGSIHHSEPRPYATPKGLQRSVPPPIRPNDAPLPMDTNITITTKRPFQLDIRRDAYQQPIFSTTPPFDNPPYTLPPSRTSPSYQQTYMPMYLPPSQLPAGYTSQPMSRDHSHQSHASIAETEPLHYPSGFSPHLSPAIPNTAPTNYPATFSPLPYPINQPGSSSHKSPKTDLAVPYPSSPKQQNPSTHAANTSLSRSSSGPGIAVPNPYPEGGLGIITFDQNPAASLQFGEHTPISLEEARQRVLGQQMALIDTEGGETG